MVGEVFTNPYTPNLVPETANDADPILALQNLERYLSNEFQRVEDGIRFIPVQAAYASLLVVNGPVPDQPLVKDVETPLEGFNAFAPIRPNRITAFLGPAADNLQVLESGVYWLQVQITATVDTNTTYAITIAVNGVLADIGGAVDVGNQSTITTVTFYGLRTMDAGDIATVVVVATAGGPGPFTWIMESATFSAVRISELHDEATP